MAMASSKQTTAMKTSRTKRQRIGPKALIDLLDDPILREIIAFLPDPETVCTLGGCCRRLKNLVKGETAIWDRFLEQIPVRARPKTVIDEGHPERTAKEIVLWFSSARIFAARMERLAPLHRVMLGEGNYCAGCNAFPNATGYDEGVDLPSYRRKDTFFVRYSVSGSLLWQGFLPSFMCNNGDIYLGYDEFEFDLSGEFDWPEMKAYLAYPAPRDQYGYLNCKDSKWLEEKERMARAMYKHLTLTIVLIKDDITDRHLAICTCGPDGTGKDKLGPHRYCQAPHMEIMPVLSHGVSPKEPMVESYCCHPYLRTTEDNIHCGGDIVAVGHNYEDSYSRSYFQTEFLPQKYIGPVFQIFNIEEI